MISENSYRNPFSEYNANVMDSDKILNYWCSPLDLARASGVAEADIYSDRNPIVFMGGRGSGKTMFLKYHSYNVQVSQHSKEEPNTNLLDYLIKIGGIGFYIRIDGPVLRSFVGKGVTPEIWEAIFIHYFELKICRAYLEVFEHLESQHLFNDATDIDHFVVGVNRLLGITCNEASTCQGLLDKVDDELRYVNSYRADVSLSDLVFHPSKVFASQDLVYGIPLLAKNTLFSKYKINFLIFIDEYENFEIDQQRIINTLLKFVKPYVTFRIGMRLEGFRTFATVTRDDFIKEGRDYRKVVFEDILVKNSAYRKLLLHIAKKRLADVPVFKDTGFTDISKFLGIEEDLHEEAKSIVKDSSKKVHFDILKSKKKLNLTEEELSLLYNDDNPLMEMLNIVYALRGVKPEEIHQNMIDYINHTKTKGANKYRLDFIDKYKLSLLFLLASQYRKTKMYYSFNTFAFLSSGIVGNFIELCRKAFQAAAFDNIEMLLEDGKISPKIQDEIAKDHSHSELQGVVRIDEYGKMLHVFAKNMGNVFRSFHSDLNITYPETLQFAISLNEVKDSEYRRAISAALQWSIIQKKPRLQRIDPSKQREDLYMLNRIFSPAFQISYRIRGGYSVLIDSQAIQKLMSCEDGYKEYVMKKYSKKKTNILHDNKKRNEKQINLF
jgi:hypothetical protein